MKRFFVTISLLTTLFSSSASLAYDIDTHFYETYMMARYTGFTHEVAAELAVFAQWVDVTMITSPMFPSMIMGMRLRRLFHFPSELYSFNNGDAKFSGHGVGIKLLGITREDNAFSRELIMEGLRRRDLMMIGGGIHVRQDSFGHAGYPFSVGHGLGGHSPDRPFQNLERHARMTQALFRDLVLIRGYIHDEGLDKTFVDTDGDTPHYLLSAEALQERYLKNPHVRKAVTTNIFKDPRYLRKAVEFIFNKAREAGIFTENFSMDWVMQQPGLFTQGNDTRTIFRNLVTNVLKLPREEMTKYINIAAVREKLIRFPVEMLPFIPQEQFIEEIVFALTENLVAYEVNEDHPALFEAEGAIRAAEMRARLDDWRAAIFAVTGRKIRFASETLMQKFRRWRGNIDPAQIGLKDHELLTPTMMDRIKWQMRMFVYASYWKPRFRANPDNFFMLNPVAFDKFVVPQWEGLEGQYQISDIEALEKLRVRYARIAQVAKQNSMAEEGAEGEELAGIGENPNAESRLLGRLASAPFCRMFTGVSSSEKSQIPPK